VTCLGTELDRVEPPSGGADRIEPPAEASSKVGRSRWYTHHLSSSPAVRAHAAARGLPAGAGRTTIEISGQALVAVTEVDGVAVIRTTARVGQTGTKIVRGNMRYLGELAGRRTSGSYPYLFEPVAPFEIESLEFLVPDHPVFALRPANPLEMMWGFYSPRSSFAYPGTECE